MRHTGQTRALPENLRFFSCFLDALFDLIFFITQEPVKVKGKTLSMDNGKEREEIAPFPTKPKTKKQPTTKKENQVEKSRFVQSLLKLHLR